MLCETCSSVTWSNFRKVRHEITGKPQYRYVHHESLEALEASSASSCHLCALIYHNLESDSPSADARDDNEPGYMEHSLWVDDSEDDAHRAPPRSPSRVYLYAPSLEGWHVRAYAPTGSTLLRLEALAGEEFLSCKKDTLSPNPMQMTTQTSQTPTWRIRLRDQTRPLHWLRSGCATVSKITVIPRMSLASWVV
jgi:hypothetical protein